MLFIQCRLFNDECICYEYLYKTKSRSCTKLIIKSRLLLHLYKDSKAKNFSASAILKVFVLQGIYILIVSGILSNLVNVCTNNTSLMYSITAYECIRFSCDGTIPVDFLLWFDSWQKLKGIYPGCHKKHQKKMLNWYCTLLICIVILDTISGGLFSAAQGFNAQSILVGSMYMGNPMISDDVFIFRCKLSIQPCIDVYLFICEFFDGLFLLRSWTKLCFLCGKSFRKAVFSKMMGDHFYRMEPATGGQEYIDLADSKREENIPLDVNMKIFVDEVKKHLGDKEFFTIR